ncbi:MAG: single-stranded-DNA-specific exonuclease RecJ [Nitrospinales bacterium]
MTVSLLNKNWKLAEPSMEKVEVLARELKLSPLISQLLVARNIESPAEAEFFLKADLAGLHNPFLMKGMSDAVNRIVSAIEAGEKITIYGDYDVDGVTAASLMVHFLRELNTPFGYYLPERMSEGYGINNAALQKIYDGGSSLVISADCGITAVKETIFANEIGLDVIITDHHQVGEEGLPQAIAVLNPHQKDCEYPYRFLSGVGIIFKLTIAIRSALHEKGWEKNRLPNMKKHLDLFALGTIADVAPLSGENHVLTLHGLEAMRTTLKPGLVALKAVADLNGKIEPHSVGFGLGPRLNAAGRLGKADAGFHLLTCEDLVQAKELARSINDINIERKKIQEWTQDEADYLIDREIDLENRDSLIVLASENFHAGVIGIVASRIAEKYFRPVFLIAMKDGLGKGSARSIPSFNVFKAMTECSQFLGQFGGHAYAAGLNIEENNLNAFKKAMNDVGHRFLTPENLVPELNVDSILNLPDIDRKIFDALQELAPFGTGNPAPVFMSTGVRTQNSRIIGQDKNHVKFKAVQSKKMIDVIGFNLASAFQRIGSEELIDMVYEIDLNEWNGKETLQLKVLDLRQHIPTDS